MILGQRLAVTNVHNVHALFYHDRLLLDFVCFEDGNSEVGFTPSKLPDKQPKPASKVKCVVWDLDNTLWDGIIGDVGPENVKPNLKAITLIKQLDQRGVIHSIASKNTFDICWPKIAELGLEEYFLYPAIHWGQKSQSLKDIARELNINLDTFVLIDDSAFERSEVKTAYPQVRCYDPIDLDTILNLEEFNLPVTEFSRERRRTYLAEANRKRIAAAWSGDYDEFLRSCQMVMRIRLPQTHDKLRCLELLQRTNQLNLSGRRFSAEEFGLLLQTETYECYAFECEDKFGQYGIVGFSAVDIGGETPIVTDFVLSCRVAQKKVEETFLYWYASKAQQNGATSLRALFLPTERNGPLYEVLKNIPFLEIGKSGNGIQKILEFSFDGQVSVPDIVRIEAL